MVLTTYDMITGSEFHIFRNIPRWEMLVVDEGQRRQSVLATNTELLRRNADIQSNPTRISYSTDSERSRRYIVFCLQARRSITIYENCSTCLTSWSQRTSRKFACRPTSLLALHPSPGHGYYVLPIADEYRNLEELEQRFDQDKLNEGLIGELHEMIKPYILRRIKADVLKLPPKVSRTGLRSR